MLQESIAPRNGKRRSIAASRNEILLRNSDSPFYTVSQFAIRHPAFTDRTLRAYIFNAEDRSNSRGEAIPGNGLAASGALVRQGRRILIDEPKFIEWVRTQSRNKKGGGQWTIPGQDKGA